MRGGGGGGGGERERGEDRKINKKFMYLNK